MLNRNTFEYSNNLGRILDGYLNIHQDKDIFNQQVMEFCLANAVEAYDVDEFISWVSDILEREDPVLECFQREFKQSSVEQCNRSFIKATEEGLVIVSKSNHEKTIPEAKYAADAASSRLAFTRAVYAILVGYESFLMNDWWEHSSHLDNEYTLDDMDSFFPKLDFRPNT